MLLYLSLCVFDTLLAKNYNIDSKLDRNIGNSSTQDHHHGPFPFSYAKVCEFSLITHKFSKMRRLEFSAYYANGKQNVLLKTILYKKLNPIIIPKYQNFVDLVIHRFLLITLQLQWKGHCIHSTGFPSQIGNKRLSPRSVNIFRVHKVTLNFPTSLILI